MPAVRSPSLKVRTPAFQAGDIGFKSRRSCCGYRIMEIRQIVALHTGAIPLGHPTDGYA